MVMKNSLRSSRSRGNKNGEVRPMKKIMVLLLLLSIIATPSYALSLLDKLIYNEVRLGQESVLVNRITGQVEKKLVGTTYQPISTKKGWGGIISDQEMYQERYNRLQAR